MPRQRMLFALIIFAALLAACSAAVQAPTPAPSTSLGTGPTAVSVSVSPYDGSWEGGGTAQDGREITIRFTVQGGAISSFTYSYLRPDNIPCTGIDHNVIPVESQPRILNDSFSQVFGPDLTADWSFVSPQAASGHIAILWQGRAYLNSCNASLQAAWTATKQKVAQIGRA